MANGEKSENCSWNFRFLHMKDVEICKILTIVENFFISPHDKCRQIKIYPVLLQNKLDWLAVYAVLPWHLFCRDLRAFCVEKNCSQKCAMWRKNDKYDVWPRFILSPINSFLTWEVEIVRYSRFIPQCISSSVILPPWEKFNFPGRNLGRAEIVCVRKDVVLISGRRELIFSC